MRFRNLAVSLCAIMSSALQTSVFVVDAYTGIYLEPLPCPTSALNFSTVFTAFFLCEMLVYFCIIYIFATSKKLFIAITGILHCVNGSESQMCSLPDLAGASNTFIKLNTALIHNNLLTLITLRHSCIYLTCLNL